MYFEDFAPGYTITTSGRTITEADIVAFAGLSGDFHPIHTDEIYARQTPFGKRVAHGALILSISLGLATRLVSWATDNWRWEPSTKCDLVIQCLPVILFP